ncbi:type IV pilin protein [Acinetobacter indicus]|uniref:type IV pilin protein n=1 Tax=Acinetobacter indicus TaxID=756892 RepID=UPI0014447AF6|nr:type IV pilin protein [Acinetobacter indicus]
MKLGSAKGFTLIELVIVVAIIGILVGIAYPSYTQYRQKVSRADVKAEMLVIATDLQKYKTVQNSYLIPDPADPDEQKAITLAALGRSATVNYPYDGTARYQITLTDVTRHGWTLIASPQNQQSGTGVVALNHRGEKCWVKGSSTCEPTADTTWDE